MVLSIRVRDEEYATGG